MTKKVFFDTDCISSFFRIGQRNIIEDLFNARIVFPERIKIALQSVKSK